MKVAKIIGLIMLGAVGAIGVETGFAEELQREEPVGPSSARPIIIKVPGSYLGLEEAVRIGLANHPLIERSRNTSLVAQAVTKRIRGELYPWLEASIVGTAGSLRIVTTDGKVIHDRGGHGFDPGGAIPKHNQNMVTAGLLLNQLITDFGNTAHRILANEAEEASTEKEILTHKALVIFNVQKAYLNCLMQQELVTVAKETLDRRKAILSQVGALYRQEIEPKLDLDLIEVELANAEMALIQARNELAKRFAALNNTMGIKGAERYELEKLPIEVTPPQEVEILLSKGMDDRPELLGARDRIKAKQELIKASKARNFGSITAISVLAATQYGDVHDGGIPPDGYSPFWGVGATVRFPIFTGFRIQNRIEEAGHRKEEAEHELGNLVNEVGLQIIRARLAQGTNAEQIPLQQDLVSFSKEALDLAQERYRLGLGSIIEVVQSTTALFQAQARLVEARYLYKISELSVLYATGQGFRPYVSEPVGKEG